MIEDAPLLTIRRRYPRPTPAEVGAFAGVPTGFVVDALGGAGGLDHRIKPIGTSAPNFAGAALTCHAGPADNLAVFGALNLAQPGDVVLASAAFDAAAVTGDLLLGMLKNRGAVAFITDGCVRDVAGIRSVGLPCFAAGVTPNSPARNGPGTVGMPIVIGGVAVDSGDIIVGDEDGVVVVPRALIGATIARLPAVRAAEAAYDARVKAGQTMPDFLEAMVRTGRFREID